MSQGSCLVLPLTLSYDDFLSIDRSDFKNTMINLFALEEK
jgi:hypothetical protein